MVSLEVFKKVKASNNGCLFIMEVSRITYKCYTRWNGKELRCLCKVGNPACDRYKTCEIEEFEHDEYKGIKDCMQHSKYKKQCGVIKQI